MKKALIALSVFAVALMLALAYITARFVDKDEIARVRKNNAAGYQEQTELLQKVDGLNLRVAALQDSVLRLELARSTAYRDGYDEAIARYDALNEDHIQLLQRPPRVSLFSGRKSAIVAGVAGAVIGTAGGYAASR